MILFVSHLLKFNNDYSFYLLFFLILVCVLIGVTTKNILVGALLLAAVLLNYIYSDQMNHNFLHEHGHPGRGMVTAIEPTEIWVNDVRQLRLKTILKDREGKSYKTDFTTNDSIYDTALDMTKLPGPDIGEEFAILYMPGHETNFAILPDDKSAPYGKRVVCTEIAGRLQSATAAYKFTPNDETAKRDHEKVSEEFRQNSCI